MEDIDQSALSSACRALLRPIASFLMKCGMTWREFSDLSKSVFVEVASSEYGINGRPTNVSRVALLTGINRKEVGRQRQLLEQQSNTPASRTTDATRVLSGWYQDPEFSTDGAPRVLSAAGEGGSFEILCQRYAPDIPVVAMLKELKRVGAVSAEIDEAGEEQLTAQLRYYMPTQFDPQWIMNAGSVFADLGNNINHNVVADEATASRFLGRASDPTVPASAVPEFYQFIETHGQPFLEMVDEWLTEHRNEQGDGNHEAQVRLGVGLFLIHDE